MANEINIKLVVDGKEANATLSLTDEQLNQIARQAAKAGTDTTSSLSKIGMIVTGLNQGLEVAKKAFDVLSQPLDAAGQFEQYETSLKVMLGSTEAAKARLQELVKFAKETPFELPQVVEAANQLQAIGRYSEENLRMLGDLASASGKPMEQALSAYAKMMTGQKGVAIDMFRDLLISADDWAKATGAKIGANGELQASVEQMASALPKILKEKGFDGMMQAQSETFKGMTSNMSDAFGQLETAIGEKLLPAGKEVANMLGGIAGALTPTKTNLDAANESAENQRFAFEKLVIQYEDLRGKSQLTNDEAKRYSGIIDTLQKQYPGILGNMDLQKGKLEDIRKGFENVRAEMEANIRLELRQATAKDYIAEQDDAIKARDKANGMLLDARAKLKMIESGQMEDTHVTGTDAKGHATTVGKLSDQLKEDIKIYQGQVDNAVLIIKTKQFQIDETLNGATLQSGGSTNKTTTTTSTGSGKEDAFVKSKAKTLAEITRINNQSIEKERTYNMEYVDLVEARAKKQEELAQIEAQIKDAGSQKELEALETKKTASEDSIKIMDDEIKRQEVLYDKDFEVWRSNRDKKHEAEQKHLEEMKELQEGYYEQVQFLDDNYLNIRLQKIDQQYQMDLQNGLTEYQANLSRKESLKQLEEEYYNWKWERYQQDHALFSSAMNAMWAGYDTFFRNLLSTEMTGAQKMNAVWNSIKEAFFSLLGDMAKQYLQELIKRQVIGAGFEAASIATATGTGTAIASAYAPAAAMAAIATMGGAAIAGSAGLAATTALAYTLAVPKFADGGLIAGGEKFVRVNEEGPEFVVNADATRRNLEILEAMNAGANLADLVSGSAAVEGLRNISIPVIQTSGGAAGSAEGFKTLGDRIENSMKTLGDRMESVERIVRVDAYGFKESMDRFNNRLDAIGG